MSATVPIAPTRPTRRPATRARRVRGKRDGKATTFTHDGRNRLIKAVKANGTTIDYGYNVDGLRIETVENATGTNAVGMPTEGTRTRYWLSGSEEIADLDSGRNVIRRYIPGAGIDERVAQLDADGNVVFIHNDKQNSVIAISNILGAVIQKRAYGTYGETDPAQMTSAGTLGTQPHPFGYTGRRYDPDLGLYYYRARWYDPQLGTFLQTDPIGALDYINLYAYVGAEPGNGTDPTGMCLFRYDTGGCKVLNPNRSLETDFEQSQLELGLNNWDRKVNALSDNEVVPSLDSLGNVVGSLLGRDVKADWNATGWMVVQDGSIAWNNGGVGWAEAAVGGIGGLITSEGISGYLASDGLAGIDLFIGHEFGGHITDLGVASKTAADNGLITRPQEERDANRHARGLGRTLSINVPCRWGAPLCD